MKKIMIVSLFIILLFNRCAYQAEDKANNKEQTCANNLAAMLLLSSRGLTSSDVIFTAAAVRYASCRNEALKIRDSYIIPL